MPNLPRIIIADDHRLVGQAYKHLLQWEYDVVAVVEDGRALMRSALELEPQLIVVDVAMPLLNGLDAGGQVKKALPAVKLLYVTACSDPDVAAEAFRRGASGYVVKACSVSELLKAMRDVMPDRSYISPALRGQVVEFLVRQDRPLTPGKERLTPRQREVLQLVAEGKSIKEVAYILNITERTSAFHKYRIMDLLNVRSTAELVAFAMSQHMVGAAANVKESKPNDRQNETHSPRRAIHPTAQPRRICK